MTLVTNALAWLTLLSNLIVILWLIDTLLVWGTIRSHHARIWSWFGRHALWFGFIVSLVAMLGSLYFSDYLGYEPCKLCWYQRIFMYPQVFLFGLALWRREPFKVWAYSTFLSVIGGAIALFHYYSQMVDEPLITLPCTAIGYSASCAETFITSFGYITIPFMALTAFALLIILGRTARLSRRSEHS